MNKLLKTFRLIRTNHNSTSSSNRNSSLSSTSRVSPRVFPLTGFPAIPAFVKVEEEIWEWYKPASYYPISIGDVIYSRYQVLYKLGFGTTSTIWMCRDLDRNVYACLKSMVYDYPSVQREVKAYETLSKAVATIPSFETRRVRRALDHFQLRLNKHDYHFLVHKPLGLNLDELMVMYHGRLPLKAVLGFAKDFLTTLKLTHDVKIVHTDIQPKNILFTIHDESVFQETEEDELVHPSPRKVTDQSTIFASKEFSGDLRRMYGARSTHALCDFGEARSLVNQDKFTEMVQPPPNRAPEVFLGIPWGLPVDIWSFGCLLWYVATGDQLFPRSREENQHLADRVQLAKMAMLLGPPPLDLLAKSGGLALRFFNEDGSAKLNVPRETLESRLASALVNSRFPASPDEVQAFLAFIRRVLIWDERTRPSASELFKDPWIDQPWRD